MARGLTWIKERLLDLAAGAAGLAAAASLGVALLFAVAAVVEGPEWARWAVLVPVGVALLMWMGRGWRDTRAGAPAAVFRNIPPPPRGSLERPILPPHLAELSDDELRARGFPNPAALRCMGLARYGAAAARRGERAEQRCTNEMLNQQVADTTERVADLLKEMPRGGMASPVPVNLAPLGPVANCYSCKVPITWIAPDADNDGRWEHLYEPEGRHWEHLAARSDQEWCAVCGTVIDLVQAPSGAWWAHRYHPADSHDAVLRGPVPEDHVPLILTVPAAEMEEAIKRMGPEDMPPGGVLFLPEEVRLPDPDPEDGGRPNCYCTLLYSCARCDEEDAADDDPYPDVYPEPDDRKDD